MDGDLSGSVRAGQLNTVARGKYEVIHYIDDPDTPPFTPKRKEEWKTERRPIDKGGQGQVFLQKIICGGRFHTQRAVKKIPLAQGNGGKKRLRRELEAITQFSQAKVFQLPCLAYGYLQK
jgi:hypothetical protein